VWFNIHVLNEVWIIEYCHLQLEKEKVREFVGKITLAMYSIPLL
jgi:hypothetical protein